jgi:heme oxygenase
MGQRTIVTSAGTATPAPPTTMAALRAATRDAHLHAEQALTESRWLDSPSSYQAFLLRLLRFHEQVEVELPPALPYTARRRSPLIRVDLAALTGHAAPAHTPSPRKGGAAAIGCLYVVEGSALGGRVLLRQITSRLGYDATRGASCFLPYGPHALPRWRAFGSAVDVWAAAYPESLEPMVAAARSCFATYERLVVRP